MPTAHSAEKASSRRDEARRCGRGCGAGRLRQRWLGACLMGAIRLRAWLRRVIIFWRLWQKRGLIRRGVRLPQRNVRRFFLDLAGISGGPQIGRIPCGSSPRSARALVNRLARSDEYRALSANLGCLLMGRNAGTWREQKRRDNFLVCVSDAFKQNATVGRIVRAIIVGAAGKRGGTRARCGFFLKRRTVSQSR